LAAPVMYVAVIVAIRITGKRAASQMNNFDWIVTVAIGSLTASGIVIDSVSVLEAITAIALLLGAQYLLTRGMFMSSRLTAFAKASPTLLVHKGQFIRDALRHERVTPDEVMAAVRENGLIRLEDVQWVILETDATLSVIPRDDRDFSGAQFDDVSGFLPAQQSNRQGPK
ncbi:MAG: YetF domain-containing protein, partial [Elainellaceae cyanobacterium]